MHSARFYSGDPALFTPVTVHFNSGELWFDFFNSDGSAKRLAWKAHELKNETVPGGVRKLSFIRDPGTFLEFHGDGTEIDKWFATGTAKKRNYSLFLIRTLLIGIIVFALSIIPLLYFVVLPLLADYTAEKLPVEYEIKMGKNMADQLLLSMQEVPGKSAYCDSFVTSFDNKFRFPIKIHVVKQEEINAFALPGGEIFIHTAMIDACNTKEELAALLGHEIGHVELRHASRSIMRSLISSAILSFIVGDLGTVTALAADKANQLKSLEFSRKLETAADEFSLRLLANADIDPNGLVKLFRTFKKEEEAMEVKIPEFLSTHPLSSQREKKARKNIKELDYTVEPHPEMQYYFEKLKSPTM